MRDETRFQYLTVASEYTDFQSKIVFFQIYGDGEEGEPTCVVKEIQGAGRYHFQPEPPGK